MTSEQAKLIGYQQLMARFKAMNGAGDKSLMAQLAKMVQNEAGNLAPHKTGNLRRTINVSGVTATTATVTANANYAAYVEFGTGLYGPEHRRITPTAKKALRWMGGSAGSLRLSGSRRSGKAGAGAGYVFARSTAGSHAQPFLFPGAKIAVKRAGVDAIIEAWNSAA